MPITNYLELPDTIVSLDEVTADLAEAYEPAGEGFALTQGSRDFIAQSRVELARVEGEGLAEIAALQKAIERERGLRMRDDKRNALREALTEAGVKPGLMKGATALLGERIKTDGDELYADSELGPVTVQAMVAAWTRTEEGREFVALKQDIVPSDPVINPWMPQHRNLTRQGQILRADRAMALRLMRAAGISETEITTYELNGPPAGSA